MSKTFHPYDPEQQLLLPAALEEWLPEDHMAYLISDMVEHLDLSAFTARYRGEDRGGPPCPPRMMVKVLLYGYCTSVSPGADAPPIPTTTQRKSASTPCGLRTGSGRARPLPATEKIRRGSAATWSLTNNEWARLSLPGESSV